AVFGGQVGADQFGDACVDGVGRHCRHRQVYPGCACPYTSGNAIRVVVGQVESMAQIESKLPHVGTTIFTVMSQLAAGHGAVNLGQGFPDFEGPPELFEALSRHVREGRNQYAPMTGVPKLREQIALKTERLYGRRIDADSDIPVTSGATDALYAVFAALVRRGDEVILLDPCYDSYAPAVELNGGRCVRIPLRLPDFAVDWQRVR